MSRTLIPQGAWTDIPVRIMNVGEKPLPLKPGTVIADLQQVEVVDDITHRDQNVTELMLF